MKSADKWRSLPSKKPHLKRGEASIVEFPRPELSEAVLGSACLALAHQFPLGNQSQQRPVKDGPIEAHQVRQFVGRGEIAPRQSGQHGPGLVFDGRARPCNANGFAFAQLCFQFTNQLASFFELASNFCLPGNLATLKFSIDFFNRRIFQGHARLFNDFDVVSMVKLGDCPQDNMALHEKSFQILIGDRNVSLLRQFYHTHICAMGY